MEDYSTYDMVSKTPDYTGIPGQALVKWFAKQYGIPDATVRSIAFVFQGWTIDNIDQIKEMWDAQ